MLFTLGELGLFIEGIDNLAKQLFVDDSPFAPIFNVLLRVLQKRVEFLVFGLIGGLSGWLREVSEYVKL